MHVAVWVTITIVVIIVLNCFSARVYGEADFWFASLKVIGINGLLMMTLVLILSEGPNDDFYGFRY